MADLSKLKLMIETLRPDDLVEIRNFCTAKMNFMGTKHPIHQALSSTDANAGDDMAETFLDCIVETMQGQGADMTPRTMLMRGSQFPAFRHKFREGGRLAEFFTMAIERNRVQRRALMLKGAELLFRNLREMNVPISSRAMMNHVHRVPSCLYTAFPGYAESGALHLVIRQSDEEGS